MWLVDSHSGQNLHTCTAGLTGSSQKDHGFLDRRSDSRPSVPASKLPKNQLSSYRYCLGKAGGQGHVSHGARWGKSIEPSVSETICPRVVSCVEYQAAQHCN